METYIYTQDELDEFNASHVFAEDDEVLNAAKKAFKVEYLYPWQRLVISNILDSYRDQNTTEVKDLKDKSKADADFSDAFCLGRQIVLLPTGAGKSMCFLVPSIMLDGATLIIYPLLGLMADQERRMKEGGISSVIFRGGQTEAEREESFKKLKDGAKIIIANPEVLQNENLLLKLKEFKISHIAIDEAHCVSEWGDSFRPAYLKLGDVIKKLDVKIVTAFTATASPKVLSRIAEVLFDNDAHIVRSESDRPNIHYHVHYAYAKEKEVFKLCSTCKRPILIFCGTRAKSEELARDLRSYFSPDDVRFYHAGLSREEKTEVEKWYFPHKNAILCSTCAFGMGIDKSDIRTVIHYEPSTTAESYIQEAGRGGRDRKTADAYLIWNYDDSEKFGAYEKNSRERVIKNFAESTTCRRQVLLDALGAEKAICSGCDVCDAARTVKAKRSFFSPVLRLPSLNNAEDMTETIRFIKWHQKQFTKKELIPVLKNHFNMKTLKLFKCRVWTEQDIRAILVQLEKEKKIKTCGFLWNKKIAAAYSSAGCSSPPSAFSPSGFGAGAAS